MSKVKYAIYRGKVGLYAKEYIDTMEGVQRFVRSTLYKVARPPNSS